MDKTETGIPVEEKGIEHLVLDWLQWSNEFDVKRAEMTLSLLGERSVALKDCEARLEESLKESTRWHKTNTELLAEISANKTKLQEASEIIEMLKGDLEYIAQFAPLEPGTHAKEALAHPKLKAWEVNDG